MPFPSPIVPQNPTSAEVRQVEDVNVIKSLALAKIAQIKEITHDKKLVRESMKSIMDNNDELSERMEEVDPMLKEIKALKAKIKQQEDYKGYEKEDKELKEELEGLKESLSNLLRDYTRLTGVNVIEDETGKEYKIKHKCSVSLGQLRMF